MASARIKLSESNQQRLIDALCHFAEHPNEILETIEKINIIYQSTQTQNDQKIKYDDEIQNIISEAETKFQTNLITIQSKSRRKNVILARKYIAKHLREKSYTFDEIGQILNKKPNTTYYMVHQR